MTTPSTSVSYTSDARNLRQSRTVGAVTQQFTWSSVGALPLLLGDGEHSFLFGPSSTPLAQIDDTTGQAQYLHSDLLGTPRLVTDQAGEVAGTVSFDAFGSRTTHTGVQSVFGFTGNLVDALTGLLYLRARDYDPATGQFLTVDPAVDTTRQPYAYTGNNPVQRTDPSGLDWQEELLAVGAGAADGLTGGLSSMILSAAVPGYDCFIQEHNTAFQVGSIVTQVAVAVVMIVGTAGAGAVLVAARYAAAAGIKAAVKTALREGKELVARTATRLADDTGSVNFFATAGRSGISNTAQLASSGKNLARQLASEQQLGEVGSVIAGAGTQKAIRAIDRLIDTYGGSVTDWVKKSSSTYTGVDGIQFATHWYENISTGTKVEQKVNLLADWMTWG